jgi:hypothetical protein
MTCCVLGFAACARHAKARAIAIHAKTGSNRAHCGTQKGWQLAIFDYARFFAINGPYKMLRGTCHTAGRYMLSM